MSIPRTAGIRTDRAVSRDVCFRRNLQVLYVGWGSFSRKI